MKGGTAETEDVTALTSKCSCGSSERVKLLFRKSKVATNTLVLDLSERRERTEAVEVEAFLPSHLSLSSFRASPTHDSLKRSAQRKERGQNRRVEEGEKKRKGKKKVDEGQRFFHPSLDF